MSDFFKKAFGDVKELEKDVLGPDYPYHKYIKSPEEMGMSDAGSISTIARNVTGLIGYIDLLAVGGGKASKVDGPLGDNFFLKTGAKCKDTETGKDVTRSIYFNNIPDGSVPFITSSLNGVKFTTFEGLVPGIMGNLTKISPMQMFHAFKPGTPQCSAVTRVVRNENNVTNTETAFITLDDQKLLDGFATLDNKDNATATASASAKVIDTALFDYSKIPNDPLVKLYYSSLALFGLYILMLLLKKTNK
jgi:hypothetical protein